jgi:hypothetical protein
VSDETGAGERLHLAERLVGEQQSLVREIEHTDSARAVHGVEKAKHPPRRRRGVLGKALLGEIDRRERRKDRESPRAVLVAFEDAVHLEVMEDEPRLRDEIVALPIELEVEPLLGEEILGNDPECRSEAPRPRTERLEDEAYVLRDDATLRLEEELGLEVALAVEENASRRKTVAARSACLLDVVLDRAR